MPVTEPVLTKRIPTAPWGDPAERQLVHLHDLAGVGEQKCTLVNELASGFVI